MRIFLTLLLLASTALGQTTYITPLTNAQLKTALDGNTEDILNVGEFSIGAGTPTARIHILPNGTPTTAADGIKIGSDISIFRSGAAALTIDSDVVVTGSFTLDGQPLGTAAYGDKATSSKIVWVSKDVTATDTRTGLNKYDQFKPFATIQQAVYAAASGDIIKVGPGTWAEIVKIQDELEVAKDGLTMELDENATVVAQDGGSSNVEDVALLVPSGITFRVSGGLFSSGVGHAPAVHLRGAGYTAFKSRATHTGGASFAGVYVSDGHTADLEGEFSSESYDAVWVSGSTVRINNSRLLGGTGENNPGNALEAADGSTVVVQSSVLNSKTDQALHQANGSHVSIYGCSIESEDIQSTGQSAILVSTFDAFGAHEATLLLYGSSIVNQSSTGYAIEATGETPDINIALYGGSVSSASGNAYEASFTGTGALTADGVRSSKPFPDATQGVQSITDAITLNPGLGSINFGPDGAAGTMKMQGGSLIVEGSTADANEMTLVFADLNADRTINFNHPGSTATTAVMYSTLSTNAPERVNSVWFGSNSMVFEGTDDAFELTVAVTNTTGDATWTIPNYGAGSFTFANLQATQTFAGPITFDNPVTVASGDNINFTNNDVLSFANGHIRGSSSNNWIQFITNGVSLGGGGVERFRCQDQGMSIMSVGTASNPSMSFNGSTAGSANTGFYAVASAADDVYATSDGTARWGWGTAGFFVGLPASRVNFTESSGDLTIVPSGSDTFLTGTLNISVTGTPIGGVDAQHNNLGLGSVVNTNLRTDATAKIARILIPHFTNAEEPVSLLIANTASASGAIADFGGGSSVFNPVANTRFWSGASGTVQGTQKAGVNTTGFYIGSDASLIQFSESSGDLTIAAAGSDVSISGSTLNITGPSVAQNTFRATQSNNVASAVFHISADHTSYSQPSIFVRNRGTGNLITGDNNTATVFTVANSGAIVNTQSALSTTPTAGLSLVNSTAATVGAQQASPSVVWQGTGWGTSGGASQPVTFRSYVLPSQFTNPVPVWRLDYNANGGAYTNAMSVDPFSGYVSSALRFVSNIGSASTPTYSNTSNGASGVYFPSSGAEVALTANGTQRLLADTSGVTVNGIVTAGAGLIGTPAFRGPDTDTGIFFSDTNNARVNVVSNGTVLALFQQGSTSVIRDINGTNSVNAGARALDYGGGNALTWSSTALTASVPLVPSAAGGVAIGSGLLPFSGLFVGPTATNNIQINTAGTNSASRILSLNLNDAARTLSLSGNLTVSGTMTLTTPGSYASTDKLVTTATTGEIRTDVGAATSMTFTPTTSQTNANINIFPKGEGGISFDEDAVTLTSPGAINLQTDPLVYTPSAFETARGTGGLLTAGSAVAVGYVNTVLSSADGDVDSWVDTVGIAVGAKNWVGQGSALGNQNTVGSTGSVAIGQNNTAYGGGIAIGSGSAAVGIRSVAIGESNRAGAHYSVALGTQAWTSGHMFGTTLTDGGAKKIDTTSSTTEHIVAIGDTIVLCRTPGEPSFWVYDGTTDTTIFSGTVTAVNGAGVITYTPTGTAPADGLSLMVLNTSNNARTVVTNNAPGVSGIGDSIDRKKIEMMLGTLTEDATPLLLVNDNNGGVASNENRIRIRQGRAYKATLEAIAQRTSDGATITFDRSFTVTNIGGTVSIPGSIVSESNDPSTLGYTLDLNPNSTLDTLEIEVTGEAGEAVRWAGELRMIEVGPAYD